MSTRIINLTPGLMTLPYPYRGALAPGRGGIVSDSPQTVLDNLGGVNQVEGVYRLDLTSEPGQAAFDPAPAAPGVGYDAGSRPTPAASGGSPSAPVWIFNTTSNQPEWSDGVNWYDADGNITT